MLHRIKQLKECIAEAEQVYGLLGQKYTDLPSFFVALPILYKRAIDHNQQAKLVDPMLVSFASQYLTAKYPELAEYFMNKQQRQTTQEMLKTIEEILRGAQ